MKNNITETDMLQHSFKVQTRKERHATVTGCSLVNLLKDDAKSCSKWQSRVYVLSGIRHNVSLNVCITYDPLLLCKHSSCYPISIAHYNVCGIVISWWSIANESGFMVLDWLLIMINYQAKTIIISSFLYLALP